MKKFSKIFEGGPDDADILLKRIGSSYEELVEMCMDLKDEDFEIKIVTEYIGLNGNIYGSDRETGEFFPTVNIDIERNISRKSSEYGDTETIDRYKGPKRWNGGIYYENDIKILKYIYETCYRIKSTFSSDDVEVLYSIRSINDISIRISLKQENKKGVINTREIIKSMNFTYDDRPLIGNSLEIWKYKITDETTWSGDTFSIGIKYKWENNDPDVYKRYSHEFIKNLCYCEEKSNIKELKYFLDEIVDDINIEFSRKNEVSITREEFDDKKISTNREYARIKNEAGKTIAKIKYEIEPELSMNIHVSGRLLNKKYQLINIYKMNVEVKTFMPD